MANRKTFENQYHPQSVSHPGCTLEEKLQEMEMSVREFAILSAKPEGTILSIIQGNSPITPDLAVIFENITQIPARFWINRQRIYDESLSQYHSAHRITEANPVTILRKRLSLPFSRYQYGGTTN